MHCWLRGARSPCSTMMQCPDSERSVSSHSEKLRDVTEGECLTPLIFSQPASVAGAAHSACRSGSWDVARLVSKVVPPSPCPPTSLQAPDDGWNVLLPCFHTMGDGEGFIYPVLPSVSPEDSCQFFFCSFFRNCE